MDIDLRIEPAPLLKYQNPWAFEGIPLVHISTGHPSFQGRSIDMILNPKRCRHFSFINILALPIF